MIYRNDYYHDEATGEGRKRSRAAGVNLGRKPTLMPHQQEEARRRVAKGKESIAPLRGAMM